MSFDPAPLTVNADMTVHQPKNEGITVNLRDWNRVRAGIGKLPMGSNGFMSAGWGFVGIAVAAVMQLVSFSATGSEIAPALVTVTICALSVGAVGATVSFIAAYAKRKEQDRAKLDLQAEMDELLPSQLRP